MHRSTHIIVIAVALVSLAARDTQGAAAPSPEAPVEHFTDTDLRRRAPAPPSGAPVDVELVAHVSEVRCYQNSIAGSRAEWVECALSLELGPRLRDLPGWRLPAERVLRGSLSLHGLADSPALHLLTSGDPMRVRLTVERP